MFGREAQHKLEKWTQSDLTRVQKKGVNWIENWEKGVNWIEYQHNEGSIRSSLAVWGVWGCWKGHPIGLKISKMRVITAEPPYHAKVWEYPPPGVWLNTNYLKLRWCYCGVSLPLLATSMGLFIGSKTPSDIDVWLFEHTPECSCKICGLTRNVQPFEWG